ncbi:unnamed protein product [Notodromas monacha]|uniref:YTH domain-containing protein n=1 Tax=Notodromas monacha TaxID=399045 RepID=A0A7R9G936_9CRUS|nr:unnamed protein product [Notodromas monacha]CAG0913851.1 unnamed protein product [Notodromas monacha]
MADSSRDDIDYDTRSEASSSSSRSRNISSHSEIDERLAHDSVNVEPGTCRDRHSPVVRSNQAQGRQTHIRKREHSPVKFDVKDDSPKTTGPSVKKLKRPECYNYITKLNYLFRDARFFVMKSNNEENIALSKSKAVWSTPPQNEAKLNRAFTECRNVLLLFSVKESGKFAGFARLGSHSRRDVSPVNWILPPGISARALGGIFQIDWITKKELPFSKVSHLYNPWNDGKPVKIGRDGQEIEPKVAEELCRIFPEDESTELTPILYKSKRASKRVSRDPQMRTPAGTSSSPGTKSRHNDSSIGPRELSARLSSASKKIAQNHQSPVRGEKLPRPMKEKKERQERNEMPPPSRLCGAEYI